MKSMIDGKELEPSDIGKPVVFTHRHGAIEYGRLSSFQGDRIFVKFNSDFGELCEPSLLSWGETQRTDLVTP